MQLRVSCVAAIYNKSLKLSSTHQETNASSGRIMNLASNDVERFLLAALFISHLIWSPIQSIAILIVGCVQMGPSFAVGFCLLIFGFVPFQFYLSNRFAFLRSKIAGITDQRVNFVSQAVQGSRVMKMSGYEYRFLDRIMEWRNKEVCQITQANRLKALNEAMFFACNIVVSLVIFFVHVAVLGGTLTPGNVYTVFTLVNILQIELTKHVSLGVMGVSEVYVSISRIQKFLEFPERPTSNSNKNNEEEEEGEDKMNEEATSNTGKASNGSKEVVISMSNVDCYWNFVQQRDSLAATATKTTLSSENNIVTSTPTAVSTKDHGSSRHDDQDIDSADPNLTPALSNINLDLERGQLTCVIGTVGSGKSALLQAIVGELPVYRGSISRTYHSNCEKKDEGEGDSMSYAAQDPWIMDGTVRENVTMGLPFRQEWYDQVIDACGLRMDFQIFRHGDSTIVGDRGVQCSGGQRARIGLARAIYRDADVLVADDPLSAVDAKVGRQIFHEALLGLCVNRGKCVLLATHQHQYVHNYRCVLLLSGHIECIGSYTDCVDAAGGKLSIHEADNGAVDNLGESIEEEEVRPEASETHDIARENNNEDKISGSKESVGVGEKENTTKGEATDDSKEGISSGVVEWKTYKNYIRAMGGSWTAAFILLTFCVTQGVALWTIITMGKWAELPPNEQGSRNILGLIIGQGCLAIMLATFRAFFCFGVTIKASKKLHDEMAKAVLRAKIVFFDTNP